MFYFKGIELINLNQILKSKFSIVLLSQKSQLQENTTVGKCSGGFRDSGSWDISSHRRCSVKFYKIHREAPVP